MKNVSIARLSPVTTCCPFSPLPGGCEPFLRPSRKGRPLGALIPNAAKLWLAEPFYYRLPVISLRSPRRPHQCTFREACTGFLEAEVDTAMESSLDGRLWFIAARSLGCRAARYCSNRRPAVH